MSGFWNHVPQTVRPRSAGRPLALPCLWAFGLTAIVVYGWGAQSWIPTNPEATHTATAHVVGKKAQAPRIPIAYTDNDPRRAEDVANALAERYVDDRRADWKRRTEMPRLKAREATEKARRELAQGEARLVEFQRQLAEDAAKRQAVVPRQAKPLPPSMVDNPRWIELNRRLGDLQQRCDNLLIDRTRLHPAVQEVAVRIDELKQQMASIPRQIPQKLSSPDQPSVGARKEAGSEGSRPTESSANDRIAKQNQHQLDELAAMVERTRQVCQRAEATEKQALQEQLAGPQYSVERAQVVEIPPTPNYGWWRLIGTTLASSVVMAFGIGSVLVGTNIEPPVASIAEVQAEANATVVGTIPADDPVPDPSMLRRRQSHTRRSLIAIGLILILACPTVAIWGVIGI